MTRRLFGKPAIPLKDILVKDGTYSRRWLKDRLIRDGILEYKCAICGIFEWNGTQLSLQIDHINGIKNDNRLSNLRLLCPNCHSGTSTFAGKNKQQFKRIIRCTDCGDIKLHPSPSGRCRICSGRRRRKVPDRPSIIKLKELLASGYTKIELARMYNVSNVAISKWMR